MAIHRFFSRAVLVAVGLLLAGCTTVGVGGSYGSSSGLSGVRVGVSNGYYQSYPDYGYSNYPGRLFLGRHHHTHRHDTHHRHSHDGRMHDAHRRADGFYVGRRDWRQGDGAWRRDMRRRDGTPLAERQRLGRSERIREQRQDRSDAARAARGSGVVIEGNLPQDFGDGAAARRQDRATQAERANQRRALQVRQDMLARRRATLRQDAQK